MWKTFLLCALVALSAAEKNRGAWRDNVEYRYKVRTQTLAAIPNLKNQWTGLFTKADLLIRRVSEDTLNGKLLNGEQSEFHDSLQQGPTNHQPDSELTYSKMTMNSKPFEIRLNKGVIHSIAVDKEMTNVELNQLKSVVSQLQVDIQARNLMKTRNDQLPLNRNNENSEDNEDNADNDNQATYQVMEPTITGKCQTNYDISRVPLYLAQAYPEINDKMPMNKDDSVLEIIKSKNYSNCEQRMGYHFGVVALNGWKPNTNEMGSLSKSAISRVVITGAYEKYTIRSSITTNRVVKANPDKDAQQDSMVVSQVNVTLESMEENDGKPLVKSDKLVDVGNLVYSYDMPSDIKNALRPKKDSSESDEDDETENSMKIDDSDDSESNENDLSKQWNKNQNRQRKPRSASNYQARNENNNDEHEISKWQSKIDENRMRYMQPKPTLKNAPENPMLNLFIGNKGSSIQSDVDFNGPAEVEKMVDEIVKDLEDPNELPVKQTLRKFNVVSKILRTMNAKQITETTARITDNERNKDDGKKNNKKRMSIYRDALANAGTGPAIDEILKWIEEGKLAEELAAEVLTSLPKNIREPTEEMQKRFFAFVKNPSVKKQEYVNNTAGIVFTRLMYQSQVNHKYAKNFYPVDSYMRMANRNSKLVKDEVIPYFAELLKESVQKQDAPNTLYAIRALGNIGHSDVLKVFEPYFDGKIRVTNFQRLAMVLALDKCAVVHPKTARTIYTKIYQNKGETHEIRSAAVFALMTTNPSAAQLQRMAEETNYEKNNDVRAAVRSAIESAARLTTPDMLELAEKAKSAMSLLKPEQIGVQYSRTHMRDHVVREMEASYVQTSSYIVSKDSFIPSGVFLMTRGNLGGFKRRSEFQATVSSVEELYNFFNDKLKSNQTNNQPTDNEKNDDENEDNNWTGTKILNLLNMKANKADKLEGQLLLNIMNSRRFVSFDKRTLEQVMQKIKKMASKLKDGYDLSYTKVTNPQDVMISFPLETGLPFSFVQRKPNLIQLEGRVQAKISSNNDNHDVDGEKMDLPNKVIIDADIKATYSVMSEETMTFINPSTRQRYSVGCDKKLQVHVPVRVNNQIDIRNREWTIEIKPSDEDKETKVLQMGSWPYTTRDNALSLRPLPESKHTKNIHAAPVRELKRTIGEKSTGFAINVKGTIEHDSDQLPNLMLKLSKYDIVSAVLFDQDSLAPQHYSLEVSLDGKKSSSKSVKVITKYDKEWSKGNKQQEETKSHPRSRGPWTDEKENKGKPEDYEPNSQARRQQYLRDATEGMAATTSAHVLDVLVEINGSKKRQYIGTISGALSKAERKARVLAFARKSIEKEESQEFYLQLDAKCKPSEDNDKPEANVKLQVGYGFNKDDVANVKGHIKVKQSDELKEMINRMESNKENNRNAVDQLDVELDFKKATQEMLEREFSFKASNLYNVIRYSTYLFLTEEENNGDKEKITLNIRMSPEMESANISMTTETMKSHWKQIPMTKYVKKIAIIPSGLNLVKEIKKITLLNRDTCQISRNKLSTFENSTIENVDLGNKWHLAVHKMRNQQDDENENQSKFKKHVSVLIRNANKKKDMDEEDKDEDEGKKKEVMIVLHQNSKKDVTLRLSPDQSNKTPRLHVDNKEKDLEQTTTEEVRSTDGARKVLATVHVVKRGEKGNKKHEIKVETNEGKLEITYDGENVEIQSNDIGRNNRGLCGSFSGQQTNDLKSPQNQIVNNHEEFISTWAIDDDDNRQSRKNIMAKYPKEEITYVNPMPMSKSSRKSNNKKQEDDDDNSREQQSDRNQQKNENKVDLKHATKHQTQYVQDESRICFSKRPLPVCAPGTKANGKTTINVEVVCRDANDSAAQQYKNQIRSGRNLDLSSYRATKELKFTVPKRCETTKL